MKDAATASGMDWEEGMKNFHIALRLVGMNFHPKHLELIWEIQKVVTERGDLLTLKEIAKIETAIEEKYSNDDKSKTA